VQLQLLLHRVQRVWACGHVGRPIRRHDEQACRVASPRQDGEQVDGRRVAPLQVFQHQDERDLAARDIERLDDLPEHAVGRRSLSPALHRLELLVGQKRRQMRQPARCVAPEGLNEDVASRRARQSPERLENRKIGFTDTVLLLDALPAGDPDGIARRQLGEERFHQSRLPDPRFPGDEGDLASAAARLREHFMKARQLGVPSDEGSRSFGRNRSRGSRAQTGGTDEAESTPMDGLDVPRRAGLVGQRSPQVADAARERGLAHDDVAPDHCEELVLRDEPIGMLDEMAEDGERLWCEVQHSLATPGSSGLQLDANHRAVAGARDRRISLHRCEWPNNR
jgi:hypothetical protein